MLFRCSKTSENGRISVKLDEKPGILLFIEFTFHKITQLTSGFCGLWLYNPHEMIQDLPYGGNLH